MSRPVRGHRIARCGACWLPPALCLCAALPSLQLRTRLVVVMHRNEAEKNTNTGRLAVLAIAGAALRVRGRVTDAAAGPLPDLPRLALFPSPGARVLSADDAARGPVVLLVPDGSWTQARKLARRDDDLRMAEPVTLPPSIASRYRLRRSPREGGLCTLEAVARAVAILESPTAAASLLDLLDRFVERTLHLRAAGGATTP